jgi:hypothetical protein
MVAENHHLRVKTTDASDGACKNDTAKNHVTH